MQSNRRGDPTSTSSDSGYDAQPFSPYHRGDNSSNDEELISSQEQQTEVTQKRPSLAARTRHLYPRDEDEDDYINLQPQGQSPYNKEDHSDKGMEREMISSQVVEVESRPSITVRRDRISITQKGGDEEDDSRPCKWLLCDDIVLQYMCVCILLR